MSNALEAALKYAERGWPVYAPSGKEGESYSTIDAVRIKKHRLQHPDWGIKIDIEHAGLWVLRVEGEEGIDSLIKLGMPPETLRAKVSDTASDLFFHKSQTAVLKSGEIAKGLTLNAGVWADVPPSNGSVWINDEDEPVAEFPEHLTDAAIEAAARLAEQKRDALVIILPSDQVPFIEAAANIFPRFPDLFMRGEAIVELTDGKAVPITPQAFRSRIELLGLTMRHRASKNGPRLMESRCPVDVAAALLETREARELLPPLRLIVKQPLLTEENGSLILLHPGYNSAAGGVFVLGSQEPEDVPLDAACAALLDLLAEFEFVAPGDKSRAIASFITPALAMGGFLSGRIPLDMREADHSQAGKGLMQAAVHGIYGEEARFIAQRKGGVGSFDESIAQALIAGRPFVIIDNVRGRIDSPMFEAVLTATGPVVCRVPYRGELSIDPRGMLFQLTSNGLETTEDLANRSSIVRIRKRSPETQFRPLLEMIEERQPFYLGCVHAVVREWHKQGKPRAACDHDFKEWAWTLNWIVQELFGLAPLMDAHREVQQRVGDPAGVWLREVALAAVRTGVIQEMSASRILELCVTENICVPGHKTGEDELVIVQRIGRILSRAFNGSERLVVDGIPICRLETSDSEGRPKRYYTFGGPHDGF